MKINKKQRNNIFFFIILALILFTPVGTYLKVGANKVKMWFSTPETVTIDEREFINNFDWKLQDLQGNTINFKQFEGEIVFVNFWATWCPPCVAEMPNLHALYSDYKGKIKFVFVANDEKAKVSAYLEKNDYDFPVYFTKSSVPEELFSKSIPATYLIDDQGAIAIEAFGAYNWNSDFVRTQIDELLAFSLAK